MVRGRYNRTQNFSPQGENLFSDRADRPQWQQHRTHSKVEAHEQVGPGHVDVASWRLQL
jgi:hypothetical protein